MQNIHIQAIPYRAEYAAVCKQICALSPEDLEKSKDQGGHGGTMKIKIPLNGQYIFLKPKAEDNTEARNYQVIATQKEIAKWMPTVLGEVQINGKTYLAMENIRKANNGKELVQLADIKLSGKVDGLSSPIVSETEVLFTRGKKKKLTTRLWMEFTAHISPGFMMAKGGIRLLDYVRSQQLLQKSVAHLSTAHLDKLTKDLQQMQRDLKRSGIAFIGASIAFIRQEDGSIKPILLDPAHIQCSSQLLPQIERVLGAKEASKVFSEGSISGGKEHYKLYKKSNEAALQAIAELIHHLFVSRPIKPQK